MADPVDIVGGSLTGRARGLWEALVPWFAPVLLLVTLIACFILFDDWLQRKGITTSGWSSALVWWGCGLVFAFGWPLRYWKGMRGLWKESVPAILVTSVTGPFAIILGFPL